MFDMVLKNLGIDPAKVQGYIKEMAEGVVAIRKGIADIKDGQDELRQEVAALRAELATKIGEKSDG